MDHFPLAKLAKREVHKRGNVVSNLLTFGHWKVVFSLFLILYRAFSQVRKPHVLPISQEENGPIMIPKTVLKSGL